MTFSSPGGLDALELDEVRLAELLRRVPVETPVLRHLPVHREQPHQLLPHTLHRGNTLHQHVLGLVVYRVHLQRWRNLYYRPVKSLLQSTWKYVRYCALTARLRDPLGATNLHCLQISAFAIFWASCAQFRLHMMFQPLCGRRHVGIACEMRRDWSLGSRRPITAADVNTARRAVNSLDFEIGCHKVQIWFSVVHPEQNLEMTVA